MKTKKIPLRSCVVTREKLAKNELLRIVREPDGHVSIDLTGKLNGRGAYIKKDLQVLERAIKGHILERQLECDIPNEVYEQIKNYILN